ncbi:acyl-CoA carboxylase subunit beta [Alkalicella caledoniensis]
MDLNDLREKIHQGGGPKRIEKQHQKGKMTARERIEFLLDKKSFVELNTFVTHQNPDLGELPGEGVVTGYGTINSKMVYIFAQDFTVSGGALGKMHAQKICNVMDLAAQSGCPIIGLNDSGGARIQEGVDSLHGYGEIFYRNTIFSGVIPQISVIMGPCAGGAVYSPAITDFILMSRDTSQMFITGPEVIKSVTGEKVNFQELGGADVHSSLSGVAHLVGDNERATLNLLKKLLRYIPQNNLEVPAKMGFTRPRKKASAVVPKNPNQGYDVVELIESIVDDTSFLEIHKGFAKNAVVGFATMEGNVVGVVANQPKFMAGCLDIDSSDKIARFVRFLDSFNIPLLTFVDVPGYLPGVGQEHQGIIRHGAKVLYSYADATIPKITVVVRKGYGGSFVAMGSKALKADMVYAWPQSEIAVMGPKGAVNILYKEELKNLNKQEQEIKRDELLKKYIDKFANPFVAASKGMVDEVINPDETRDYILNSLMLLAKKQTSKPSKKHGNIPL